MANDLQHLRAKLLELDPANIERSVNTELALHTRDSILRGLGKVIARPAGCAQLRDHLLVIGKRHEHVDSGLLLEERNDVWRRVVGPSNETQLGIVGRLRAGDEASEEH